MGLENWGEWAVALLTLATGFGLLYAKVSSIVTRLDGLVLRMKEDREEHLRFWKKLDNYGDRITKLEAKQVQGESS